ncbi:MAG: cation:proton antiporter, partial [Candidatus Limnocylindrales bacterium]
GWQSIGRYHAQVEATAGPILELGALLLVAAGAGWIARRVGLPAIVGYLVIGVLVSPFTPGFVAERHQLELMADLGVVLLLFEVGIEVDLVRLRHEQRGLIWAAPLQVLISAAIAGGAAALMGLPTFGAAIVGLSVAISSGVVVVNITRSSRRTTDPQTDHALLGWSVIQDVTGVAASAVVLAMAGLGGRPLPLALAGLVVFAVLAAVVAWLLPRVLVGVRDQSDTFLIVSVASGLVVAGLGSVAFGVPLALAAFVGGLAIAESPATAEARRRLRPFRDLFAVLFFVAIGTLIDPAALASGWRWLALALATLVVGKILVTYVLSRAAGLDAHPLQMALGLGQLGEFGYVLAGVAITAGLFSEEVRSAILAAVAISIVGSTVLVRIVRQAPAATSTGGGALVGSDLALPGSG